jgi:hypothetical protein
MTGIKWTPLATAIASLVVQACSGGSAQTTRDAATGHDSGSPPARTYAPTMTAIYDQILNSRCAQPFCHLGGAGTPPILTDKEASYLALVNAPASGMKCAEPPGADEAGADFGCSWFPVTAIESLLYRRSGHNPRGPRRPDAAAVQAAGCPRHSANQEWIRRAQWTTEHCGPTAPARETTAPRCCPFVPDGRNRGPLRDELALWLSG